MDSRAKISLKLLHTFHCDVFAREVVYINNQAQLTDMAGSGYFTNQKWLLLGGGSNVLFINDFDGTILVNNLKGCRYEKLSSGEVAVEASSGESWHDLVLWSLENGFNGIENLSLIPGTVGAAPIQNIGAYGTELKDVFHSLCAMDVADGKVYVFNKEDCDFGYRDSIFKRSHRGQYIILSVRLILRMDGVTNVGYGDLEQVLKTGGHHHPYSPKAVSDAVVSIRQSKLPDPDQLGNAGSFFKNPVISSVHYKEIKKDFPSMPAYPQLEDGVKIPAGWLIDQCGFKGVRRGDAGCHSKQALVLVNYDAATGGEILSLANEIIEVVYQTYGIRLEPEVNIIAS